MDRHPHDSYEFEGTRFRLLGEQILVHTEAESDQTESGLIYKAVNAHEHVYAKGKILAWGYVTSVKQKDTTETKPVPRRPIADLEAGMGCVFVKFRKMQDSNQTVQHLFGENIILLRPEDILFTYGEEDSFELGQ